MPSTIRPRPDPKTDSGGRNAWDVAASAALPGSRRGSGWESEWQRVPRTKLSRCPAIRTNAEYVEGVKLANLANFTGTGKTRIFAADRGWRVTGPSSSQNWSDVRTAQMPLPVALADPLRD